MNPEKVIHDLEQRLNRLTLTLHCLDTPIENHHSRRALCAAAIRKNLLTISSFLLVLSVFYDIISIIFVNISIYLHI